LIAVFDDVIQEPDTYRQKALASQFGSVSFGEVTFHGVAPAPDDEMGSWFAQRFPMYEATVTFLRKSPLGQAEPNFIHSDEEMGDVTAILYLNPNPPKEDGTVFWKRHKNAWESTEKVDAKFNRAVVFDAPLYHSRAIERNYGSGNEARLIQVLFAKRVN
jgi:hypothetical protein